MTEKLGLTADQLRSIPLLKGFSDSEVKQFSALATSVAAEPGAQLFDAGQKAENFYLLVKGEITLHQDDIETHRLHPPALIGELNAITGRLRNSRATVGEGAEIWRFPVGSVREFFRTDPAIGLRFQENLLEIAAEKINRDQTRLQDMRSNLIRTQKSMKRMRDFLLESQDTVVSRPLHEILDGLIKRNRRVNYRVRPPQSLPAELRCDGHDPGHIEQISRTHLSVTFKAALSEGDRISGVLNLSGPEIPVSGKVLRTDDGCSDVELDLLIEEYVAILEGYLTRVQLLDVLV